jgi:hypothetical protein
VLIIKNFTKIENKMIRLILEFRASPIVTLVFFSLIILRGCGGGDGKQIFDTLPEKPATGVAGDGNLPQVVEYIRINSGLPALAAVLVHDGQIIEMAATGTRKINNDIAVTNEDK